jgi:general secretion pathway protein K
MRLKQQGFALLTVLIIVALVSVIASGILYQQRLDVTRSAFMLNQSQAIAVSAGIDAWIKKGLAFDASQGQVDHLGELWAQPMLPMEFEGGDIGGQLFDMQARFNLNNLTEPDEAKRNHWRRMLERLSQQNNLGLDWIAPLIDWVDADNAPTPGGAESDVYLLREPPYRAANRALVLVEELRLLQGLSLEQYQALLPWVASLPSVTPINVNTAPTEVLTALADWMSPTLVETWLELRMEQPAEDLQSFRQFVIQNTGMEAEQVNAYLADWMISVKSDFFQLRDKWNTASRRFRRKRYFIDKINRCACYNDGLR